MSDLSEFCEEGFSPAAWINQACERKPGGDGDEPLDRYLAELEMRLQLSAEELEASLQDCSSQAMRRIPFAVQEIYRLQGDMQGLQDQVSVLATQLQRDSSEAGRTVASIAELDKVKTNMEAACRTLREATELSGMFVKVEDVFAAGDLPRAAEMLSSMRRSLSLVGDVPEFKEGRQRLRLLEDRLQARVEHSLADALAPSPSQDPETAVKLCHLLLAVDRYATVERLFTNARLAEVAQLWDEYAAGGGVAAAADGSIQLWLPKFYAAASHVFERESRWCAAHLPEQRVKLVSGLVSAALARISKPCTERLLALKSPAAMPPLLRDCTAFARGLLELLRDAAPPSRESVAKQALAPLERAIEAYPQLEAKQLRDELSGVLPPAASLTAAESDAEAVARALSACIRDAVSRCQAATQRCVALTGGSELIPFLKAMDSEVASFLSQLQAVVSGVAEQLARAGGGSGAADDATSGRGGADEPMDLGSMLQLLQVAANVSAHISRLEASARSTVTTTVPKMEAAAASAAAAVASPALAGGDAAAPLPPALTDPLGLRLKSQPQRLTKLQRLAAALQEGSASGMALQASATQLDAFTKSVHDAVYRALLAAVRSALSGLEAMACWQAGNAAAAVALPSFNAYASNYVTAIGDYLMALPQELEVLVVSSSAAAGSGADDEGGKSAGSGVAAYSSPADADAMVSGEELAAAWLDKLVSGAAGLFMDSILRIPRLSPQGGVQLAADVEYFNNVMSALHVMPPAGLLTVQLFAGQPADTLAEAARAAIAEGSVDVAALRAVAALRRVDLREPASAATSGATAEH